LGDGYLITETVRMIYDRRLRNSKKKPTGLKKSLPEIFNAFGITQLWQIVRDATSQHCLC
jgi:hypothetical protein